MLKNYILFTLRKIYRFKNYAFINIMGLSIGLASFIIIMLYVYDEYRYDQYHKKADRIFRVTSKLGYKGVGEESSSQPFPLATTLKNNFPEYIENYVRFFNLQKSVFLVANDDRVFNEKRFFYVDSTVFEVFDFELIKGDKYKVLQKPFSIVITESMARKYFEDENPIGQTLKVDGSFDFEITGIIKDVKPQSHFKFDFLASFNTLNYVFRKENFLKGWIWNPCWTYILLKSPSDKEKLEAKLPEFAKKYLKISDQENYSLYLQKLTDIHLNSNLDYEIQKNDSEEYVQIMILIAFLILIIAIINYVSLATAGAANRAKEIAVKKITGASRIQLIVQFIVESLVISYISLIIALSLVELFLPAFSAISGKVVTNDFRFQKETIFYIISLGGIIGIVAGLYPALYMSSLKPLELLKGSIRLGTKSTRFRKILVLIQTSISVMLIIGTIGIFKQLKFMHNADLGFQKKQIIILNSEYSELAKNYDKFKTDLLKNSIITNVTGMDYVIGESHNTHEFIPEGFGANEWQFYPSLYVRGDFVKTFDIDILTGRDFKGEEEAGKAVLVNEEMVHFLDYQSNEEIIGKSFITSADTAKVIGVISNINVNSLHTKIEPFIVGMFKNKRNRIGQTRYIAIQVKKDEFSQSVAYIEKLWDKYESNRPFEYTSLEEILNKHYKQENILADLSGIFTILSIFIALLGIWALAAYITEYRTREIGIRKILGASTWNILKLINKEFILMIIISNLIAWPLAYFALKIWITDFAFRTEISWWIFFVAFIFSFLNAILTVSQKTIQASLKNSVEALKYE